MGYYSSQISRLIEELSKLSIKDLKNEFNLYNKKRFLLVT